MKIQDFQVQKMKKSFLQKKKYDKLNFFYINGLFPLTHSV